MTENTTSTAPLRPSVATLTERPSAQVLIIGGGINGTAIARDAATRSRRTRRVVATPTERAVHTALHTASLAARALRRALSRPRSAPTSSRPARP